MAPSECCRPWPGGRPWARCAPAVQRGWLIRDHDTAGRTRFVMPRQVALALRGGLLPREPLEAPDYADLESLSVDAVAAEATRHAEEAVRLVAALRAEWGRDGGGILRTGGVGVRALSRTAEALDVEPGTAPTSRRPGPAHCAAVC